MKFKGTNGGDWISTRPVAAAGKQQSTRCRTVKTLVKGYWGLALLGGNRSCPFQELIGSINTAHLHKRKGS